MHPLFKDMFHQRWGSLTYDDETVRACDTNTFERPCADGGMERRESEQPKTKKTMLGKAWSFCLPVDRRFR
jgi:hypothetical protein